MIQVTLHSLDTCGCKRLYQWDDSVSPIVETPIESFKNSRGEVFNTVRCPLHNISDLKTFSDIVLSDNKTKNKLKASSLGHSGT